MGQLYKSWNQSRRDSISGPVGSTVEALHGAKKYGYLFHTNELYFVVLVVVVYKFSFRPCWCSALCECMGYTPLTPDLYGIIAIHHC